MNAETELTVLESRRSNILFAIDAEIEKVKVGLIYQSPYQTKDFFTKRARAKFVSLLAKEIINISNIM